MNTSHSLAGSKMFSRRQNIHLNEILIFRFPPTTWCPPSPGMDMSRPPGPCWPMLYVLMEPGSVTATWERQDLSCRTEGEALKISSYTRKGHWINLSNSREKESNWEKECREMDCCKRMKEATSEKWGELRDKWGELARKTTIPHWVWKSKCRNDVLRGLIVLWCALWHVLRYGNFI